MITALGKCGREDEVIPLCEREAPMTDSHTRLVDFLIQAKRWEEAERWCLQGIEAREPSHAGLASKLRDRLRAISEKTGDRLRAVAFYADTFFSSPDLRTFHELRKAARKARVGKPVEAWARHYLETGNRPEPTGVRPCGKRQGDPEIDWPLPDTGILRKDPRLSLETHMTGVLIDIAMDEKKPDEILRWYDHPRHAKRGHLLGLSQPDARVADAVKEDPPGPRHSDLEGHRRRSHRPNAGESLPNGRDLSAPGARSDDPPAAQESGSLYSCIGKWVCPSSRRRPGSLKRSAHFLVGSEVGPAPRTTTGENGRSTCRRM